MAETKLYSIREVADMLRKKSYQIVYLLETGHVPEPRIRLGNRRAFDETEIEALRNYFAAKGGK